MTRIDMTRIDTGMMMNAMLIAAELTMKLGEVNRATMHPDGETPETVATHSLMLVICVESICNAINARATLDAAAGRTMLDTHKAMLYACLHDVAEAFCGDTNTVTGLTPSQRRRKEARERMAREEIKRMCSGRGVYAGRLYRLLERYEAQEEREARLVRYVDKILPKLTHSLNGGKSLQGQGIDLDALRKAHDEQYVKLSAEYPEIHPLVDHLFRRACADSERVHDPEDMSDDVFELYRIDMRGKPTHIEGGSDE